MPWSRATGAGLSFWLMIFPGFLEVSRAKARAKTVRVVLQRFPGKRCFALMAWRICAGQGGWGPYCLILGILLLPTRVMKITLVQTFHLMVGIAIRTSLLGTLR